MTAVFSAASLYEELRAGKRFVIWNRAPVSEL
jgi:hypothetical protein